MPIDASAEGWRIDHILSLAHWGTLLLAAIAILWLGIIVVRDRRHKTSRYTHGTRLGEKAIPLGLAVFVLFAIDGALLFRSTTDLHDSILRVDEALAAPGTIRVQVAARQWAWDVRYAGTDGVFDTEDDFYAVSKLFLPKDANVVYELSSVDVVHSLYLPNFRIKQDAIPGQVSRGWFRPNRLGHYEIACAQHCGVQHYQMRGTVQVLSRSDFDRWSRSMSEDALRWQEEDRRIMEEDDSRSPNMRGGWTWPWSQKPSFKEPTQ